MVLFILYRLSYNEQTNKEMSRYNYDENQIFPILLCLGLKILYGRDWDISRLGKIAAKIWNILPIQIVLMRINI